MDKLFSVLLCMMIMFLCSCGVRPDVTGAPVPPVSDGASSAPAEEHDYSYLHELAEKYDHYSGGVAPESGQTALIMGMLDEHGLKSDFVKENEILNLKKEDFEKISGLYFSDTITTDYDEETFYSWYHYPHKVILEPFEITEEEAVVSVLYGRFVIDQNNNRHWLYPVNYSMERHTLTAEEIPVFLQGFKKQGVEIYRIQQVNTIKDMGLAKEIYSRHGYNELVEQKRYELKTPDDILNMAVRVNSGLYREVAATYSLMNDIDMTGVDFSPIGTNQTVIDHHDERNPISAGFNGTVNGNGFRIKNLNFVGEVQNLDGDANHFGFFAVIGNKGYIKDLGIENASISYTGEGDANVSAGILVASLRGGRIENTVVSGNVEGTSEVGGLCGYAGGDFWSPARFQNDPSPGIINHCLADVNVKGINAVGGLAGTSHRVIIENSHAIGIVITESPDREMGGSVGGFAGHNVWATISGSSAEVQVRTVTPARCVGSFVGLNEGDVYDCFFLNTLSQWKPSGDSPRSELSNDVVGLDKKEFEMKTKKNRYGLNSPAT